MLLFIGMIISCIFIGFYHYYANYVKELMDSETRKNRQRVWDKVNELRHENHKEAKLAYFFWVLANIWTIIFVALLFYFAESAKFHG